MLNSPQSVASQLQSFQPGIPYGMGRSYGDACLNPGSFLWSTKGLDHFIDFDESSGVLTCEAGVTLRDLQGLVVPRGWMLPVTPGTQYVTVGGAIANDVHGKNHHVAGSFGDHVIRVRLHRTDGEVIDCGPDLRRGWFRATLGGVGLTGVISQATIQLRPIMGPWLDTETLPYTGLQEFFQLADASERAWEYTVSWLDCTSRCGRGIFMRANHSKAAESSVSRKQAKRAVPFTPPISLINSLTLRPFNVWYYKSQAHKPRCATMHYEPFFYPLDDILEWNRMYGPRGFFQYQTVIPSDARQEAIQAMLDEISSSRDGSFLAVLKTFGERKSEGMLSFPRPGVTLALDFPNRGARTHQLFSRLDAIVREAGGRIYLAKDARMPKDLFISGYPNFVEFLPYRDPGITSGMSRRLMDE